MPKGLFIVSLYRHLIALNRGEDMFFTSNNNSLQDGSKLQVFERFSSAIGKSEEGASCRSFVFSFFINWISCINVGVGFALM
jgi:hypothetical protein